MRPLIFAALTVLIAQPSQAATATPAAYASNLEVIASNCPINFIKRYEFIGHFGRDAGGEYFLSPNVQPEHVIVAPIFYNESKWPKFSGFSKDSLPAESVGTLNFSRRLTLEFASDGSSYTGTLNFDNAPQVFANIKPENRADAELLGNSTCSITANLAGKRIEAPAVDPNYVVQIYTLLKDHTNHVTKMDPVASIPPLEAGLKIAGPHQVDFLWRLSRAHFLRGEQMANDAKEQRLAAFQKGIDVAKKALAIAPNDGNAGFFLAANTGRYNTTKGFLKTIIGLENFEKLCLKAIVDASDYNLLGFTIVGDAHFALGQFYRLVPDSGLAKMLLGTRGSIDKSIEHLRKAVALQADRGDYLKELGVSLLCKFDKNNDVKLAQEAETLFGTAALSPTWAYETVELDKAHMLKLLQNPDDACAYSRDNY